MCPNGLRRYQQGQTIIEWLINLLLAIYFRNLVVLERLLVMVDLILPTLISGLYLGNMELHRITTPYHPQANVQVEVRNREVKNILKQIICTDGGGWAAKLLDGTWA